MKISNAMRGLVVAAVAVTVTISAASAGAAGTPESDGIVATANGTAGVAQTVDVIAPRSPNATLEVVATKAGASAVMPVTLDARGEGSVTWVPQSSGSWTVGASGEGLSLRMTKAVIAAVPTVTDIFIPNKAAYFQPMGLISVVHATEGDAIVSGTVTYYEANLGRLGAVKVDESNHEYALANLTWTPQGAGTYAFWTTFTPANDYESGTPTSQPSVSGTSYLTVQEHRVPLQLLMPPSMRIGKPSLVIAQLPDIERANVSLLVDDRPVSASQQSDGGVAVFKWVPLHTGVTDVQLSFVSDHHPLADRVVTQTVNVLPRQLPNPISVTPVVNGSAGKPWANDDVLTYPAGSAITLVTSTGNGAAVTVTQRGKCLVTGSTLYVPAAGGGCKVTFSAPGDAVFDSNSAEVIISASVGSRVPAKKK